jgi:hypothetical protein
VYAILRRRLEARRTPKTAAVSVAARIDPSNSPLMSEPPNSVAATIPVTRAVMTVPPMASRSDGPITLRSSSVRALRPPSKRINASAAVPTWPASS